MRTSKKKSGLTRAIFTTTANVAALPEGDVVFAGYGCEDCRHQFAFNEVEGVTPYCVTCGSENVKRITDPNMEVEEGLDQGDSSALQCAGCNTHIVMSNDAADEMLGSISCPVCGEANQFSVPASTEEADLEDIEEADAEEAEMEDGTEPEGEEKAKTKDDDDEDEDEETAAQAQDPAAEDKDETVKARMERIKAAKKKDDNEDEDDDEDLDDIEDEEDASVEEADIPEDEHPGDGDPNDVTLRAPEEAAAKGKKEPKKDEKGKAAKKIEATKEADATAATEEVAEVQPMVLLDVVESSADKGVIAFVRSGDSIIAHVNDISVATLNKNSLPVETRAAFADKSYLSALVNSTRMHGIRATLEDFGFQNLVVKADAKKFGELRKQNIESLASDLAAEKNKEMAKEIKACLAIASVGLTKGLWAKQGNPVKAALETELRLAGMRNPGKAIDVAMEKASDAYHKVLLDLAFDLLSKPVEVRNSLAETVTSMAYQSGARTHAAEAANVEEEQGGESIEARLEAPFQQGEAEAVVSSTRRKPVIATVQEVIKMHGSLFPLGN